MTNIEEYSKWINDNPDKVCKKIKKIYKRLVEDIQKEKKVKIVNKEKGEEE